MGAAPLERRQDHLRGIGPRLLVGLVVIHQRPVIGVADADVAFAGGDVSCGLAVSARRFLREVDLDALEPFLGLRLAVMSDVGCDQRVVVDVLARADADLALPFRFGELFVGEGGLGHAILRDVGHPRAHGNAVPVPLRIAVLRGYDLVQQFGLDRLGDSRPYRLLEPPDIDGEQNIRRAVGAFGLDALLEAGAGRDDVDLDAGILGERVEQRLDQFAFAVGVHVDVARLGKRRAAGDDCAYGDASPRQRAHANEFHGNLLWTGFALDLERDAVWSELGWSDGSAVNLDVEVVVQTVR